MTVKRKVNKLFLVLMLIVSACGKALPTIDGLDLVQWKKDKNGCLHFREKATAVLTSQKDKLKGLSEDDIIALLGHPDQNELYKRNQKFFYYFLSPSAKCDSVNKKSKRLSIRFNAMERAKDVEVE